LTSPPLGAFTRAALVLLEPGLARVHVVGHRAFCEVLSLVGVDDDAAAPRDCQQARQNPANHFRATITPVYTSRMRSSLAVLLCGAIACGPMAGHEATVPGGAGSGSGSAGGKTSAAGDISFDVPTLEVKGVVFEPQAIYAPAMMLIYSKHPITIDKQRALVSSTKDAVQKEAQAAVLATMLYDKSKAEKDEASKTKWWTDALGVLRDAAQNSGEDKVDDVTLRLMGRYTLLLNDYAGAEKAWAALVTRFPKEKDVADSRAWWAYSLLMQYKNAEALEALKADQPGEKVPELSYVIAWTRFRAGDHAGAFQAMLAAAKGWGALPAREAMERDLFLFAGRGVPLADAVNAMTPIFGKNPDQQFDLVGKLGLEAYQFAGRWDDGITAVEKAIDIIGKNMPAHVLPKLRYTEANYALRLDDPQQVEKFGKGTLDAVNACGGKCDTDKAALVETVVSFARMLYVLYATAHDDRYYQPAHDLYLAVMPFLTTNKQLEKQTLEESTNLESFKKAMKPTDGTHAKDQIARLLDLHTQEVQACYEQALTMNPKTGGTLVVHLESDQTGAIKGAATEPKSGLADVSLVAGCVADRAKAWKLPKIANGTGPAHTTRIKLIYSLAPRARASAAGASVSAAPAAAAPAAGAK
jgi:tetratricopeptide (TPR) repeat protein